jgi:hypothetical protein
MTDLPPQHVALFGARAEIFATAALDANGDRVSFFITEQFHGLL